ncbi:zinc finger protein basonuclin-2-like isoform X2 [Lampetra fluviatilis]
MSSIINSAIRCTLVNCSCECFQPGKIHIRTCDQCKHGWVAHALDKLSTQHLYHPTQVEIVQSNVVFDISSLMLYGTQAVPIRLKILLDRLFSVLKQEEVLQILHGLDWTLRDYVRGYILQDVSGKVLDRWTIMSREEEIITLQQFLRFGETKSIVELMAIQEKELLAVPVQSSKADSDIRSFIEGSSRSRSPGMTPHLESPGAPGSTNSVHHFENIPNSLAFLLPFQFINPVAAPLIGLPPNGLLLDQAALRLREPPMPLPERHTESGQAEGSRVSVLRAEQNSGHRGDQASLIRAEQATALRPEQVSVLRPDQASVLRGIEPPGVLTSDHSSVLRAEQPSVLRGDHLPIIRGDHTPSRNALSSITNVDTKPETPPRLIPMQAASQMGNIIKTETPKSIFFSAKMRHLRKSMAPSKKGRVFCNACGKTFYDKGTLKIHYNAVHLKIKHKCTIEGCNMVFSSLRSRNRHSANPNPRLHMPMLRNNRDRDLIRSVSNPSTPPSMGTPKSESSFSTPNRLSLTFPSGGLDAGMHGPLVFPTIKTVQPVPPFFRSLITPGELANTPCHIPSSISVSSSIPEQPSPRELPMEPVSKKKPRKSSMPVKIEKDAMEISDEEFDIEDDESDENRSVSSDVNSAKTDDDNNKSEDERYGDMREAADAKYGDDADARAETNGVERGNGLAHDNNNRSSAELAREIFPELSDRDVGNAREECEDDSSQEDRMDEESHDEGSQSDDEGRQSLQSEPAFVKEEHPDCSYEPYYAFGPYGFFNSSFVAAAMRRDLSCPPYEKNMTALDYSMTERFSEDGDWLSSNDPKACNVCKKIFKNSYSVKLHYKNVHLKEMHVCSVEGCNAAFPSRRSRDRHSANINLHRKLLTKGLDDMCLESMVSPALTRDLRGQELLAKLYGSPLSTPPLEGRPDGREESGEGSQDSADGRDEPPAAAHCVEQSNGYSKPPTDDGPGSVLDLSTNQSVRSGGSVGSSPGSDIGSEEGLILDDSDEYSEGAEALDKASPPMGDRLTKGGLDNGVANSEGGLTPSRPLSGGPISCSICHKLYSNKGTLRVHYKTVHLREMHRCKVPGCNMMFSSVRSRNRHSQNPNLHRNLPLSMAD